MQCQRLARRITRYVLTKANFFRYADEKLVITAAHIIQCMKDSDIFTQPTPPLSELEETYADYYQKVVDAKGGNREKAALKRESKRRLSDILQKMVFYVNVVSDGNLSKLYSSGFPVLAQKKTGTVPDTAIHNALLMVLTQHLVVINIVKSKDESNSQPGGLRNEPNEPDSL